MKTINRTIAAIFFISIGLCAQAQINTKVHTKKVIKRTKNPNIIIKPILISKTSKASLVKTVKDIKNASHREVDVPKTYWNRSSLKRWVITPQKPFSYGVGFSFHGSFDKNGFGLNNNTNGIDRFGNIHFLAKKDKEYLIHIKAQSGSVSRLVVLIRNRSFYDVIMDDDKIFRILVKAEESGEMIIYVAAPIDPDEKLLISQIQINEI